MTTSPELHRKIMLLFSRANFTVCETPAVDVGCFSYSEMQQTTIKWLSQEDMPVGLRFYDYVCVRGSG